MALQETVKFLAQYVFKNPDGSHVISPVKFKGEPDGWTFASKKDCEPGDFMGYNLEMVDNPNHTTYELLFLDRDGRGVSEGNELKLSISNWTGEGDTPLYGDGADFVIREGYSTILGQGYPREAIFAPDLLRPEEVSEEERTKLTDILGGNCEIRFHAPPLELIQTRFEKAVQRFYDLVQSRT